MPDQELILSKIHAYEVIPQRLQDAPTKPRGGSFSADPDFKNELKNYLRKSKLSERPQVDFRVNGASQTGIQSHPVRNSIVNYLFGQSATAKKASLELASSLSKAMDDRSPYTLLMLVAYKGKDDDTFRRLVMWAFPKDEPFAFTTSGETAKIKIPENVFSRSSSFTKGSLYEGFQGDDAFLHGYVIDKKAESSWGTAADYWVSKFLDSEFSLTGLAGTRLLARTLKATHEEMVTSDDRNQITDSILAAFVSKRRRTSIKQYAKDYLTDNAKTTFLKNAPPETINTRFDFDKDEFEEKVQLRVFRLDDDVVVSAPFSSINQSVKFSGKHSQNIRVTGTIVEETVKPGRKKKAAKKTTKKKAAKRTSKKKASA